MWSKQFFFQNSVYKIPIYLYVDINKLKFSTHRVMVSNLKVDWLNFIFNQEPVYNSSSNSSSSS